MTFKKLTHAEAVQEVYRYTPQILDYDRFMHIGARWLPYTMYFHEKNFRSHAVNTDALGFRYTHHNGRRYAVSDLHGIDKVNLLVGGSTALGVGSTCDEATVASRLSEITGEVWLTLAGRGYNAMQEVLLYMMHQERLPRINRVVVFSGMNTLALEGMPDEHISDHGRYYYSYEFMHYMNKYNEDMKRQKNSFRANDSDKKSLLQMIGLGRDDNPADRIVDDSDSPLEERIDRAAGATAKALKQWQLLLAGQDAQLDFVLQPLAYWAEKPLSMEEQGVFHAIDSCPNNFYRLFSGVLGKEVHQPYFQAISRKAQGINCFDMNALLRTSPRFAETLFVDRVHFNDPGNQEVASLIHNHVLREVIEYA
ncbi:hypothetical protein [Janthinobacterium agaricidamnosum]|uniref:G-D-S-L family lipolytic protein n=1 Tax=Janthinobacterium agaricidamnosum NBRC 102515 = DSM 9628 TaxID=1349767 RepID=W0V702_9BURK|nr:hypothetical protein [Janthinobacterium agaricidamnosum]CDG83128.1 putative uncharacterized protein [Janthinobacterium agaricidamnosum NBRC 102515 = DSM 9628]